MDHAPLTEPIRTRGIPQEEELASFKVNRRRSTAAARCRADTQFEAGIRRGRRVMKAAPRV